MKLGEILIKQGSLQYDDLQHCLEEQKSAGKRVGVLLLEKGFINEETLAKAFASQLNLSFIDCVGVEPESEAISAVPELFAEKHVLLPLRIVGKELVIAMANPYDVRVQDDLRFITRLTIKPVVASRSQLIDAIELAYSVTEQVWDLVEQFPDYKGVVLSKGNKSQEQVNEVIEYRLSEAPPIVKLVTMTLTNAIKDKASDVHFEPQENIVQVRYRIDGKLRNVLKYPRHLMNAVVSRLKIISNMDITNRRTPQDGRSFLKLTDRDVDLRISTMPSQHGEKVVVRILDAVSGLVPLDQLGFDPEMKKSITRVIEQPQGMLLVTGPTGSGKTTTLYAMLKILRSTSDNIMTIEDPVEYDLEGITQVQVNEAAGLTFARSLRSSLRQDPDIIMIGEIRDNESADIAMRAAMTGHFVISTMHTNSSIATLSRMLDMELERTAINSSVSGILAQRLIRKICPHCKTSTSIDDTVLAEFKLSPHEKYYTGQGCKHCMKSGYLGRVAIYEFLKFDIGIKKLISLNASEYAINEYVKKTRFKTMFDSAWEKVGEGITTVDEVLAEVPVQYY